MDLQDAACLLLEELGGRTDVAEALLGAAEEGRGASQMRGRDVGISYCPRAGGRVCSSRSATDFLCELNSVSLSVRWGRDGIRAHSLLSLSYLGPAILFEGLTKISRPTSTDRDADT